MIINVKPKCTKISINGEYIYIVGAIFAPFLIEGTMGIVGGYPATLCKPIDDKVIYGPRKTLKSRYATVGSSEYSVE